MSSHRFGDFCLITLHAPAEKLKTWLAFHGCNDELSLRAHLFRMVPGRTRGPSTLNFGMPLHHQEL